MSTIIAIAKVLPRGAGSRLFLGLGSLAYRLFGSDRQRAIENLGIAFPTADRVVHRAIARAMFRNLGSNVFDFLRLEGARREQLDHLVEAVDGMENFLRAHERGKGVIVITGHIGCWEIMPAHFVAHGFPVTVIARRMKVDQLNDRLVGIRSSVGVETIDRDENPRRMINVLRRGEILGVLIDQHTSVAGMYVPFFGKPAFTPTAAAKIALVTGASIVPMAIYRGRSGRHRIAVSEMLGMPATGDRDEDVRRLTQECSLAVEELIRRDPKQWVWFHDRWREPETGELKYAA